MESSGGAKLRRQRSCACLSAVLDIGSWCNGSRRRYGADDVYYDEEDNEFAALGEHPAGRSGATRWRGLWRRIVRGKGSIFYSGTAAARVPYYDAYTYAQNFEEHGSATWTEAENLTRSFSFRFADPSRAGPQEHRLNNRSR